MEANVCQFVSLLLLIIIAAAAVSSLYVNTPRSIQLYVVPFPTFLGNHADGSRIHPYSSIPQALDHVERNYHSNISRTHRITINLYPTYHFATNLKFEKAHSHLRLTTMNTEDTVFYEKLMVTNGYLNRRLSIASISGGIPITGWTSVGNNTYKAIVTQSIFVNQLFVDNRRIVRTRIPMNQSEYLQYDASLQDPNQARYGFQYARGQFESWPLDDAMVVVYHSWTTSHHYIDQIIPSNRTVLFTNPSNSPIGTFPIQGQRRFHVENLCISFVPNSFCFINATKTVYLMTDGSYDPMKVQIITPVNEFILLLAGTDVTNPVEPMSPLF